MGGVADPKIHALPTYHIKFGSSVTKGVRINRLGSAGAPPHCGRGVANTLLGPHMSNPAEFGCLDQTVRALLYTWKIYPLASRLSRSLKVIGTDTYRSAAYDFLLTFLNNYMCLAYRFWDKRRFQSKIANFPNPVYLMPTEELGIGARVQNLVMGYRVEKEIWQ